jgi:hypothetical protein
MAGRNLVRLPSGAVAYVKDDELELLRVVALEGEHFTIRAVADSLGMRPGRTDYLEAKWAARGWYDVRETGQLTPLGLVIVAAAEGR